MKIDYVECGDSLKLLSEMNDECIDLTLTSPPYDNLRDYNGYTFDFNNIAKQLYRVTKVGGIVVWIVNDATIDGSETLSSFKQALYFKDIGFNIHDTMIWQKDTFNFPNKTRYRSAFEYMFVLTKGKIKTANLIADRKNKYSGCKVHGTSRGRDGVTFVKSNNNETLVKDYGVRFNVWNINTEKHNKTGHPAVFPEQLANDHIITWSNKGDIVLDPFAGSGTTCKMAFLNERHYIGFDISEEYCKIARNRIDSANKFKKENKSKIKTIDEVKQITFDDMEV